MKVTNLANSKRITKIPEADVYGITCVSPTYSAVVKLSHLLNGKTVVIGGVHPSILPKETLEETGCSYVITGESEYAFRDLILNRPNEKIINAGIVDNLDKLPFPARHLFKKEHVVNYTGIHGQHNGEGATSLITSRGCPFDCAFCCKIPQTKKLRLRSDKNIVAEIKQVLNDYDVQHFRFIDDIFTIHRKRVMNLCNRIINEKLVFGWICITRSDTIDREMLVNMHKAGCREVHIGIESGSQRLLNKMKKHTTVRQNIQAVKKIQKVGMGAKVYLMVNFPGEKEKDVELTKKFMAEAKPDKWTLADYTPLPGSKMWKPTDGNCWFYRDDTGNKRYRDLKKWLQDGRWRCLKYVHD